MHSDKFSQSFRWACVSVCLLCMYTNSNATLESNSTEGMNGSVYRTTETAFISAGRDEEMCGNCTLEELNTTEAETDFNVSSVYNESDTNSTTSIPTVSVSVSKIHGNDTVEANTTIFNISGNDSADTNKDNTTFALEWSYFKNETVATTTVKSHHRTSRLKPKGNKSVHRKRKPHLTKEQYEYLVRHFTGFMPNVKVGKPTPDDDEDEIALDDGPFGSILWRDRKYLVSVLIPIGVGITGAMLIIIMAYATRVCRRRKVAERNPRTLLQPSVSRPDDIMLLDQSSDDEF